MKTSPDPRATRSREQILDAVRRLDSARSAEITVAELAREAGLSKSSFYAHFSSVDEVAVALLGTVFADMGEAGAALRRDDSVSGAVYARIGYARLVAHLLEHFAFYTSALGLPFTRRAYDDSVAAYARQLVSSAAQLSPAPEELDVSAVATYVGGGTLTLISAWIHGDIDLSDDELVDQLVVLLPPWLRD
jgi:AcrR family transcriptional regulator